MTVQPFRLVVGVAVSVFQDRTGSRPDSQSGRKGGLLLRAAWLAGASMLAATAAHAAPPLTLNNVGAPTIEGTGQGERALWVNAGSVGGQTVDVVGVVVTATRDHTFTTINNRPAITSQGQDNVFIEWRLYRAGTYNVSTDSGGVPVVADVHVQFNDADGPNNERIFLPVCAGDVRWARIDRAATTGRAFGTVAGRAEIFSLIGDKGYNNEPESGLEAFWPDRSTFTMGRTADSGFFIRLDNPTYSAFDTLDYECADFNPPAVAADSREGVPGTPTSVPILNNDSLALLNDNPTNNNSRAASENARASVTLITPPGATNPVTGSRGTVIGLTVPREGVWAYDEATGLLTFTPEASFKGYATQIRYTVNNALGVTSAPATVTVWYPAIGVTKSSQFNDANADNYAQVGETVSYVYRITAYGAEPLRQITLDETTFTGAGTRPVPAFQSGDTNADNQLDLTETWTYVATYALVAGDFPGGISNLATAQGRTAAGTVVSDQSDSANPGDGNGAAEPGPGAGNNDPTVTRPPLAPIAAANDAQGGTIFPAGRANAFSVLPNDSFKGAAATSAQVTLTQVSTTHPGVTLDPATGQVSVAAGTPAGSYAVVYRLCETANPGNCATATATVVVSPTRPIAAANDAAPPVATGLGGTGIAGVLANDRLANAAINAADITLSVTTPASHPGVTLNAATGQASVAPGTPVGTYTIGYRICENANPGNCADATLTVVVQSNAVAAVNDTVSGIDGTAGAANVVDAFANDTLNGTAVTPATVTATVTTPAVPVRPGAPVPRLDPATGLVTVPAGTPAGSYTIGYRICENADPANCATGTITVGVTAAPVSAANDVAGPVATAAGGANLIDALANDRLGAAAPSPASVSIAIVAGAAHPGVTLDTVTGFVSVAPGTPAGSYTVDYRICDLANPANCATAQVTATVVPSTLVAGNDAPPSVAGAAGGSAVIDAFANDRLNGAAVNRADITARVVTPAVPARAGAPVPLLDPATGLVDVPAATPAGTYTIGYEICERLNPANCAAASVTVVVTAAPVTASNDAAGPINGAGGIADAVSVLANDTLNSVPASLGQIALSVTNPAAHSGVTLDPATGSVSIAPGTPADTYTIGYQICERLNPANCANATVAVVVAARPIAASADAVGPINGSTGASGLGDVFANDLLGGAPVALSDILATVTAPAVPARAGTPVPVLDPATGRIDVAAGTPAGNYTVTYQLCERLNPTNCASAVASVAVVPPAILAGPDSVGPIPGGVGSPATGDVFANDLLNGATLVRGQFTASVTAAATDPGIVLDPVTGTVAVAASTAPGSYTLGYRVCEVLNPANCADGTVTVVVLAPVGGVSGTVYDDRDGDRRVGLDEARRANWIVELVRNGTVVATTRSGADGTYRFDEAPAGAGYAVVFRDPDSRVAYGRIDGLSLGGAQTLGGQNQPIDPSGVIYDAVSRQPVRAATVRMVDVAGVPLPPVCFTDGAQQGQVTGGSGEYRFDLVPGAASQCPAGEREYRISVTPPPGFSPVSTVLPPRPGPLDPTGQGDPVRVAAAPTAPTGAEPVYYLSFRLAAGDPDILNNHIAVDPFLSRTALVVTKTSTRRTANVGDLVPYEITVRNTEGVQRAGVTVVDILPPGMRYVLGTASVDGRAQEPDRTDRQLSWPGQVIPANGTVRYNLTLVVGAGVTGGERINRGLARNGADGADISNRAAARIAVVPSSVFDCAEVLGTVFEDRDRDGYQDKGEPGLPGARLATVRGELVTTDVHGRYHIACAAVPDARLGSNFVLKLDPRSLPLGWRPTADNPRSVRLTRGKFGELNFGAAPPGAEPVRAFPATPSDRGE